MYFNKVITNATPTISVYSSLIRSQRYQALPNQLQLGDRIIYSHGLIGVLQSSQEEMVRMYACDFESSELLLATSVKNQRLQDIVEGRGGEMQSLRKRDILGGCIVSSQGSGVRYLLTMCNLVSLLDMSWTLESHVSLIHFMYVSLGIPFLFPFVLQLTPHDSSFHCELQMTSIGFLHSAGSSSDCIDGTARGNLPLGSSPVSFTTLSDSTHTGDDSIHLLTVEEDGTLKIYSVQWKDDDEEVGASSLWISLHLNETLPITTVGSFSLSLLVTSSTQLPSYLYWLCLI